MHLEVSSEHLPRAEDAAGVWRVAQKGPRLEDRARCSAGSEAARWPAMPVGALEAAILEGTLAWRATRRAALVGMDQAALDVELEAQLGLYMVGGL